MRRRLSADARLPTAGGLKTRSRIEALRDDKPFSGQPSRVRRPPTRVARRKAPKSIGGQFRSEARWREEVMPGGLSGEVRPTTSGSDAGAFAPGGKNQSVCSRKPVTFGDQSLLRKSQFRLRRPEEPLIAC